MREFSVHLWRSPQQTYWNPENITCPTCHSTLLSLDLVTRMTRTLAMIKDRYPPESWTTVHPDGSATAATKDGGAGIFINQTTRMSRLLQSCDPNRSLSLLSAFTNSKLSDVVRALHNFSQPNQSCMSPMDTSTLWRTWKWKGRRSDQALGHWNFPLRGVTHLECNSHQVTHKIQVK